MFSLVFPNKMKVFAFVIFLMFYVFGFVLSYVLALSCRLEARKITKKKTQLSIRFSYVFLVFILCFPQSKYFSIKMLLWCCKKERVMRFCYKGGFLIFNSILLALYNILLDFTHLCNTSGLQIKSVC